jgi:hypothetical protein
MALPNRTYKPDDYRYGFNSAEKINEYSGIGNTYDLGARLYNPRIIRPFTPDPREREYPWQSTYAYYANTPIWEIDYKGEGKKDNKNIQQAERAVNRFNSYAPKGSSDRYRLERYIGENGLEGVRVYYPDGELYQDYPGTPENQGSMISNLYYWASNVKMAGGNDPANSQVGISRTDVEAVANGLQTVSNVSDGAAVAATVSGVGAEAAPVLYGVGRISGAASDLINIGLDVADGKSDNASVRHSVCRYV